MAYAVDFSGAGKQISCRPLKHVRAKKKDIMQAFYFI